MPELNDKAITPHKKKPLQRKLHSKQQPLLKREPLENLVLWINDPWLGETNQVTL
jgi:hypothetical protein